MHKTWNRPTVTIIPITVPLAEGLNYLPKDSPQEVAEAGFAPRATCPQNLSPYLP